MGCGHRCSRLARDSDLILLGRGRLEFRQDSLTFRWRHWPKVLEGTANLLGDRCGQVQKQLTGGGRINTGHEDGNASDIVWQWFRSRHS